MKNRVARILSLGVLALALASCEAPIPTVAPAPPNGENAWIEWRAIADTDPMERDIERAIALTHEMAESPQGLGPMVDYLGDASIPAEKKIVAIMCLTTQRDHLAAHAPRLADWTGESQDVGLRKIATHTLGLIQTPEATARVVALLDDADRSVREAAMGVLLSFRPDTVQSRLQAFWDDPETSPAVREQVVMGMPPHLVETFVEIYGDAATDLRLSPTARMKSVSVLGQLGGPDHRAILARCVEQDPDEGVKSQARGALALLESGATSPAETVDTSAAKPASAPPA